MKHLESLPDEELVERCINGSEAAFDTLMRRYSAAVYRLALGITGSPQEAEDIVQETFVRVFKHLDRYARSAGSFKTWTLTIARNQSINTYHVLKRRAVRLFAGSETDDEEMQPDHHHPDPEALLLIRQEQEILQESLKKLPERQRTALLLKAQEQMSYADIASVMGTTASSVESLIFRARQRLMAMLDKS